MIKKMLLTGKVIYHKTHPCFHFIFWPVKSILWFVHILRRDMWIIAGEEIASKQKLTIIYAGNEENKNYLIQLAFNNYTENYMGKTWLWKIFKTSKAKYHDCSLMVIEVSNNFRTLFENKKSFCIPCWILGEVDISVYNSSPIKNKSLLSDMRRIRKNKLNYEVTNELHKFNNFYYNMYLPHITKVHGNEAFIMNYDFMKKEFKNCDLLLIKKEKEYVAGILLAYTKKGSRLWSLGVKDGNLNYVRDGAIAAVFYYSVLYLLEKGCKIVNFGASRAFLKDGVLQYKKKWGLKIIDTSKKYFLIKSLSKNGGIKSFFLNNPFIFINETSFNGAVFIDSDQSFSATDLEKIYKNYYLNGINKLFIYKFGKYDINIQEIVPHEFSDRMTICSTEILF